MKKQPFFSIIYEDETIMAVNKASGISVGGSRWDDSKERLDKILAACVRHNSAAAPARLFTVHRIDCGTSGLVVFAKDEVTHHRLSAAFEERQVKKRYIAVVHGRPLWNETACDLPLVPDGNKLHLTIVDKYRGKKSFTGFRLLGSAGNFSVLEALPETGRTHQIRVHAAALGFPVVCDTLYGKDRPVLLSSFKRDWRGDPLEEKPLLIRLGLHAAALDLPAPSGPGVLSLRAPLPRDMAALVRQMEKAAGQAFMTGTV
ncbi:MAG: RluA family pseudouridine synthase [Treponema sp.]|jgi:RluA family pseudouridine synthase|nr:RluA family pseudouridine synthase [Treponema sp.]